MVEQIIKVCGIKSEADAQTAIESGASLIGTILVPKRARTVEPDVARKISQLCRKTREEKGSKILTSENLLAQIRSIEATGPEWFEKVSKLTTENGPFLVGVFRNQSLEDVLAISKELEIDIVQLHGSEDVDLFCSNLTIPVIPRFVVNKPGIENALSTHKFLIPLLDSEAGGEGKLISWEDASAFGERQGGKYLLAGGLNPSNVSDALKVDGCCGVDVSGGVETNGVKDTEKIRSFVRNAKLQ